MPEDNKPLQAEVSKQMQAWANVLDETFNGKDCKSENRKYGFALLVYKLEEEEGNVRMNYISNSQRKDMIKAMKEFIARDALNN